MDEHRETGFVIAGLAVAAAVIALAVLGWRALFVVSSETAVGKVEVVTAHTVCDSARRRRASGHACHTEFTATVGYADHAGGHHTLDVEAGSAGGEDRPPREASLVPGAPVPVRYAAAFPSWSLPDTFVDLWQGPLALAAIPTAGSFGMGLFWAQGLGRRRRGR